ncbi:MAG: HindVP family restriction endonuclease, partial [Clostridiales bacterium]|nr:HindVP family restriction endonuclease [Clostridiales bacterium]
MAKRISDKVLTSSGLFGIKRSNRSTDKHWGKNCFNSSFPTAVACYMFEHD